MKKRLFTASAVIFLIFFFPLAVSLTASDGTGQAGVSTEVSADSGEKHETDSAHGDSTHHAPHLDGSNLSVLWAIPFLAILLSIAFFPLLAPHFWHKNYGKVSLVIGVAFFIAFTIGFGYQTSIFYLIEVYLGEFIPFIVLLLSLFTVAGGIRLKGELVGTPALNSILILIGTALASWMGTTGAAMLMIRPLIRANEARKKKVHIIVFFIFLVANIGGSLTPLGDPPLFLGFLKGVSFFWTTTHMFFPMIFATAILISIFFFMDTYYYKKEKNLPLPSTDGIKIAIEGKLNFILLACIIAAVIFSGVWHSDISNPDDVAIWAFGAGMITKGTLAQVLILLAVTLASWIITSKETREGNGFSWEPILEVAKLFATIFITMVMPIAMLKAGTEGPLGIIISQVTQNGEAVDWAYFWATGILSSFLDNAPTYVVFFNTAGGNAVELMAAHTGNTLLAISAGAVFMGANTYIGNAPNFMVKSIAEEAGIPMPSFFGYFIKYSIPILIPVFILITLIFFI